MKKLTITMPCLNENTEPIETIRSIYATAPKEEIDIIVIDDCSDEPLDLSEFPEVKLVRNPQRIGAGASKHYGAMLAETPCIMILDAHMRFRRDQWMEKILKCVELEPKTAWCTTSVGLSKDSMDMDEAKGKYYGANMLLINKAATSKRPSREILEPKWAPKKEEAEYEIPCILGANYAFSREWFRYIKGMSGLKMWGTEEPFVSMKTWMAGGKCKIKTDIEIGHKFRSNAPYRTKISYLVYNKIFLCKTILPLEIGEKLIAHMPRGSSFSEAMVDAEKNEQIIKEDREYYQSIFDKGGFSIYDYCNKFNIRLP